MLIDPIVEEIKAGRREYAARFNFDVRAMAEDMRRRQTAEGRKAVSREQAPKGAPAEATTVSSSASGEVSR
jgi:hypothetical protein